MSKDADIGYISHHDEHEDLANPGPRRGTLVVLALVVGLLVLGASVLVFFLAR